jgi:hypothetical protein
MSNRWTIRGSAFFGSGAALLASTVFDQPAPLWASLMAFMLTIGCLTLAVRKGES